MSVQSIDTPVRRAALLPEARREGRAGLLACLGAIVAFSLTLPATRATVTELDPWMVAAARPLVAGLLALGVVCSRREAIPWRHGVRLALVAGCVVFGFPFTTAYGLASMPSNHGAVVLGLIPIATALYGMLRSGERPTPSFWTGALLGVLGVAWMGLDRAGLAFGSADLWLLASVAFAALGYTEGAHLARELGGARVITWALVLSLLPGSVLVISAAPATDWTQVSASAWMGLTYVCVVSMYLGMILWYHGLSRANITHASQLQLMQPVLSLFWSWWLLGESLTPSTLVAASIVLLAVVWTRRARVDVRPIAKLTSARS